VLYLLFRLLKVRRAKRLYFCLFLSWNLVLLPSRSFAQALPVATPSNVFPSFVNDLVSAKLSAMKAAGQLANAANDNLATLASETTSAIESAGLAEVAGTEGATWLGMAGAAALPEVAVGGAIALGAYGAYNWIKKSDDTVAPDGDVDLSPAKAPAPDADVVTEEDKAADGLSGLVQPIGSNYSYPAATEYDPDPKAHTQFYNMNQPAPVAGTYTIQEPGCTVSDTQTCTETMTNNLVSYDPIAGYSSTNYQCSQPQFCAESEFWSYAASLSQSGIYLKNVTVQNNYSRGSLAYLFSYDEYMDESGTGSGSLTKFGSDSQTFNVNAFRQSQEANYPLCGQSSLRVGASCDGATHDPYEIGDDYARSPLELGKAVPAGNAGTLADPAAMARLVNNLWQQAAAGADYAGAPYPSSNPLTEADVSPLQSSSSYPDLGDLADYGPSDDPTTSPGTGTSTNPGTGTSTNPGTGSDDVPSDFYNEPSVPKPDDPTSPLISDILDPIFGMFPGLTKFTVPSQAAACPKLEVTVFGKDISADTHCQLIEANKDTIGTISAVVYAAVSLLIILSA